MSSQNDKIIEELETAFWTGIELANLTANQQRHIWDGDILPAIKDRLGITQAEALEAAWKDFGVNLPNILDDLAKTLREAQQ